MQIGMFDGAKLFINNKPIRLIELFGGIGCQAKALENLNVKFEHYRMCDFDKYAVQSYNAVHGTNFMPSDITKITAEDLGIVETNKYDYIMTYSFPCQDLSLAGKGMGMQKGSGTRSGLLWEVERLLDECKELPQVLLMENVPDVIGTNNMQHFAEWIKKLESLGYKNYWKILNAKDFGIPQNRERCFMVSILGDYYYNFPSPTKLELRLKDMLEENVDEKYYLSEKLLNFHIKKNNDGFHYGNFLPKTKDESIIARTITNPALNRTDDNYVVETKIAELIPFGSYYTWKDKQGNINTQCNRACNPENLSLTIPTIAGHTKVVEQNLKTQYRIRKLVPIETWRLMGLSDADFDKAKTSGVSNSQLYKQAGNGIVVNVLMAIFKNLNLKGEKND